MFFVDLPSNVELGVTALIVGLFDVAILWTIARAPFLKFFSAYKEEWGLALSAAFLAWLEGFLPSSHPEISVLAVTLGLAIFAAIGFFKKFAARRGVQGFI
jgi:hypothetical protein